jgi:hypothetical protein
VLLLAAHELTDVVESGGVCGGVYGGEGGT